MGDNGRESRVSLENVNKQFGKRNILEQITLHVSEAEIFGLLGPSGAGKTTLVKLIAGIESATSGTVYVLNQLMPKLGVMNRIGYMAQADALYSELTALENLDFFASLYGLKGQRKKQRIEQVLGLVDLISDAKKQIVHYSGGMKRRLSLAAALLHEPEILILDEPTVGIDPVLRQTIWRELDRLSAQGMTIIVTTHVMDEAEKCHNLGMIRNGKLLAVGTPQQLKQQTSTNTIEEAFLIFGGVTA